MKGYSLYLYYQIISKEFNAYGLVACHSAKLC